MVNRNGSTRTTIPESARHVVQDALAELSAYPLEVAIRGRYCYVSHAGDPLCRLGWRSQDDVWDFAIWRYSRANYAPFELASATGTPRDCIRTALRAYDLW